MDTLMQNQPKTLLSLQCKDVLALFHHVITNTCVKEHGRVIIFFRFTKVHNPSIPKSCLHAQPYGHFITNVRNNVPSSLWAKVHHKPVSYPYLEGERHNR